MEQIIIALETAICGSHPIILIGPEDKLTLALNFYGALHYNVFGNEVRIADLNTVYGKRRYGAATQKKQRCIGLLTREVQDRKLSFTSGMQNKTHIFLNVTGWEGPRYKDCKAFHIVLTAQELIRKWAGSLRLSDAYDRVINISGAADIIKGFEYEYIDNVLKVAFTVMAVEKAEGGYRDQEPELFRHHVVQALKWRMD